MECGDNRAFEEFLSVDHAPNTPHLINNYLYFSTKNKAREAGEQIVAYGFNVKVKLGADGVNWLVLASQQTVPTKEYIKIVHLIFNDIANKLDGEYDGWEIEIINY